jgi:hypothetical protein
MMIFRLKLSTISAQKKSQEPAAISDPPAAGSFLFFV